MNTPKPYCTAFEQTHTYNGIYWTQVLDVCNGGLAYQEVLSIWICSTCLRPSKEKWRSYKQRCAVCRNWYTAPQLIGECPSCWPDQLTWRKFTAQAKNLLTARKGSGTLNPSTATDMEALTTERQSGSLK